MGRAKNRPEGMMTSGAARTRGAGALGAGAHAGGLRSASLNVSEVRPALQGGEQDEGRMPVLRVQAAGRLMSDFSFSVRCPFCGGRYAPDDGSCCEPPDEEEDEDVGRGVGPDDGPEGSRSVAPSSPRALRRTLSTPSGRRGSDCIHTSRSLHAVTHSVPGSISPIC